MIDRILEVRCFVTFKPLRHCCGLCEYASRHIWIDLRDKHNIGKVFLHELLHLLHPKWREARVLWWEHHLWKNLTHDQVELLYRKLYRDAAKRRA